MMTDQRPPPRADGAILVDLVNAAARAPSSHNTQPWAFRGRPGEITLAVDRQRALPVNDPAGRESIISCGAALFNLTVAARAAGLQTTVHRFPEGTRSDVLAAVTLRPGAEHSMQELCSAIEVRHTTRGPMKDSPIDREARCELAAVAGSHGIRLIDVGNEQRGPIADLIAEGDRVQFADPHWRRELARWMRPLSAGEGLAVPPVIGAITRTVVSRLDLGRSTAAKDHALATAAPMLAVLATETDEPQDWLHTGEGLEHLLLHAASRGLHAGYLNQPCQVGHLRPRLAALTHTTAPQIVLRIGQPTKETLRSPRRAAADVIEEKDNR